MLTSNNPISHPLYPSGPINYRALHRNQQGYLSALKAMTDLVFCPPSPVPLVPLPVPTTPPSHSPLPAISPLPGYPETSYLDSARLLLLSTDAADATALYMYLLLYRQLVCSESSAQHTTPQEALKVDESDLLNLKKEIRDIGSSHLGYCFTGGDSKMGKGIEGVEILEEPQERKEWEKWHNIKRDIVLQIAMRANDLRRRKHPQSVSLSSPHQPPLAQPDEQMLRLAERWSDSNMQPGSPLSVMLRDRLRDAVFKGVVAIAYPARDMMTGRLSAIDLGSSGLSGSAFEPALGTATGMEPLVQEIRSLAERLSRLALIHLNAYLPLYEQEGFLEA